MDSDASSSTAGAPGGVLRTRYAVDELAQARDWIGQVYGAQLQVRANGEYGSRMTVDQVQTDQMTLVDVDVPFDVGFRVTGQDQYVFLMQRSGAVEIERAKQLSRFGAGDTFLAMLPDDDVRSRNDYADLTTVSLPAWLINQSIDLGGGHSGSRWEFTAPQPVDGGARRWRRVVEFVRDLAVDLDPDAPSLILQPAARLLAATALASFPNTAFEQAPGGGGRDATPDTVRRAIAFIESDPAADITLADIARAAYVTPRAVQLAFRRHLDTTPLAYLRRVRLHCAREELLNAMPDSHVTVTHVAQRWGFANPSRFAHLYHQAYAERPSQTLWR